MFYLFIFFLFTYFATILYKNPKTIKYKSFWVISWLVFVFVAGLRYELGVDFFAYKRHLNESPNIFNLFKDVENFAFEPGYKVCLAILKTFTNEIQIVLLVASIFCTYSLFRFLSEYIEHKYIFISLLTYFFSTYMLMEMQALRQAIAAAIIYFGYSKLIKGEKIKAMLLVLLAFTFHSSALFFLFIFLFVDKKIRIPVQLITISISLVIFILRIDVISEILNIISSIIPETALAMRMNTYLSDDVGDRGVYIMYFVYLLYYLCIISINKRVNYYGNNRFLTLSHNLIWLYLILSSLFWKINFLSTRIGWYFLIGFALMVPTLIQNFKPKQIAIIFIFLININLARHFIIPDETTRVFAPYQGYIECKILGETPTGKQRAEEYLNSVGKYLRED